jgi:hypothetical protein
MDDCRLRADELRAEAQQQSRRQLPKHHGDFKRRSRS